MAQAEELRRQQILQRRFQAMGLEAGLLAGGRSVLVTLPVGPEPFETPQGPRRLRALRFYTVGHDRIKCLAPLALFHVPLVRILDCESPAQLEARVRTAWSERVQALTRTRRWLDGLGVAAEAPAGTPQWSFPLGLEDARARGLAIEPHRVVLPSRGPLSGMVLAGAEERVFEPDRGCSSAIDLELAVTARLEVLAREKRRVRPQRPDADLPAPRLVRLVPALVVGARLAADRALHEALLRRGFTVEAARGASEAMQAFRRRSFEVVLAEARLDRGDGSELIPALRELPGILDVPVALVDDRPREGRRSAADAAGAAAYWAGPLEGPAAADALAEIAATDRRRFARYDRALSISWAGCPAPGVTASVGRGGVFLKTPVPTLVRQRFALHLPGHDTLEVDGEPIYRLPAAALGPDGFGLRFCGFAPGAEQTWIDFVAEMARPAA